jgi:hypothetical protein
LDLSDVVFSAVDIAFPQAMDQHEAAAVILEYVYTGALGSTDGKGVGYALMHTTGSIFTYSVALETIDGPPCPVDRYQIEIERIWEAVNPKEDRNIKS